MPSKTSSSKHRPFEFLLTLEQKQRCVQLAYEEGISLSELVRRAVCDYSSLHELKKIIAKLPNEASL